MSTVFVNFTNIINKNTKQLAFLYKNGSFRSVYEDRRTLFDHIVQGSRLRFRHVDASV